jgi:hypothetical protein
MFLEALVELLFLYNSEKYVENVLGTSFKEYPKYSYTPYKAGRKSLFMKEIPLNLTNLPRKTPLVFKGDSGRPRVFIPIKIILISRYYYIKIIIRGWYLICRDSKGI